MTPEAIHVLHFADTHIGMENYGRTDPRSGLSSRVVDFLRRMDEMIAYARDYDVDLVIFAGDAFKTRTPNPTYQREFAWRIRELADLAPVVMLVGNHDIAPNVLKASSIEIYDTLAVPNVWVANDYTVRLIETKRGPVVVGTGPYPVRGRLLEAENTNGMTIAQTDALLQQKMGQYIHALAEEADQYGDVPRLFTGHFTVSGAVVGSERDIMLGRDIAVGLDVLADDRWDYVALGHIHKHQNLTKTRDDVPPVVYSGSMERIDFGEEGDPKGFCRVDLMRRQTRWEFVKVDCRPFVTLRHDLTKSTRPTEDLLRYIGRHDLRDSVVRLLVKVSITNESELNEMNIRAALRDADVYHVAGIRRETDRPDRARLGTNPEGLTHAELLERYLISREIDADQRQILMEMATEIFDHTP
jgi:exonuclease SbcD